jgi:serine/threonine-protein kinase HipA
MSKTSPRRIEVYAHWETLPQPILMGTLNATPARGKEIFSFTYNNDWLKSNQAHILDPSGTLIEPFQIMAVKNCYES